MCHSCKMSDHNAKRCTVGTENQRRFLNRFLNRKVEWRLYKKYIYIKKNIALVNKDEYFKSHLLLPFDSFVSHHKNVGWNHCLSWGHDREKAGRMWQE